MAFDKEKYMKIRFVAGLALILALAFSAAAGEKFVLKLAHDQKPDQGYGPGVARFVEILKEKAGDAVEIQVFDNGVLGNERDVTEGITLGSVEMCITTLGVMMNYEPLMGAINLPFLFDGWDQVNSMFERGVMRPVFDTLAQKRKMRVLSVYALGFRNIATNRAPIASLADMKGLKLRVPQAPLFIDTFKALGANPTPVPWGELYTAMQTKVVDAFENSSPVVEQFKMYEVAKYLSKTGHIWEGGCLLVSERVFASMPQELRTALEEAALESAAYQRKLIQRESDDVEAVLGGKGMAVNELDIAPFREAVKPIHDDFIKKYGGRELIESMLKP